MKLKDDEHGVAERGSNLQRRRRRREREVRGLIGRWRLRGGKGEERGDLDEEEKRRKKLRGV
jgi:hypothetical protein